MRRSLALEVIRDYVDPVDGGTMPAQDLARAAVETLQRDSTIAATLHRVIAYKDSGYDALAWHEWDELRKLAMREMERDVREAAEDLRVQQHPEPPA